MPDSKSLSIQQVFDLICFDIEQQAGAKKESKQPGKITYAEAKRMAKMGIDNG